ncbi:MAG: helix-turn-helix transcriptional regulator [Bacteroidetes bacterium]|nr:helix-turn-helix transcriptional regulator [Bacteroidota bacterium]
MIFGLKLKQLRLNKKLSITKLSKKSGISISYLNEIENGKKYPKSDKIAAISSALNVTYDNLVSLKLTKKLKPIADLLESNILEQLPLDHYGIDLNKLVVLLSNASLPLSALVSTIVELAKNSEMSEQNFSRTALRTYKEFNENYFEDIEISVDKFITKYNISQKGAIKSNLLIKILTDNYNYIIDKDTLNKYPVLSGIRSVVIPGIKNMILLNKNLSESQLTFTLGKELGYNFLNLKERNFAYSQMKVDSFDQLLNNFRASYFSSALILNKQKLVKDLKAFFNKNKWNPKSLQELFNKYNSSPETTFQRIAALAPKYFNLNSMFFLRFNTTNDNREYNLIKELRLNLNENPGGYAPEEHYCRRWVSLSVLNKAKKYGVKNKTKKLFIDAQISEFFVSKNKYFCFSVGRTNSPFNKNYSSVTLGFLLNDNFKNQVKFWDDPSIKEKEVNDTCERCMIKNCKERASAPSKAEEQDNIDKIRETMAEMIGQINKE